MWGDEGEAHHSSSKVCELKDYINEVYYIMYQMSTKKKPKVQYNVTQFNRLV